MNDNSFVFQTRLANLSCDPETVRQGRQRKSVRKGVWIFSQRDVRWQNWKPSDYGSGKPIPSEKHRLAFTVRKYALVVKRHTRQFEMLVPVEGVKVQLLSSAQRKVPN